MPPQCLPLNALYLQTLLRQYSLQVDVQEVLSLKSNISHDLLPSLSKLSIKIMCVVYHEEGGEQGPGRAEGITLVTDPQTMDSLFGGDH